MVYLWKMIMFGARANLTRHVPWHDFPSPVYPSLQVQKWEPLVLVQFALSSQAWSLRSLTSTSKYDVQKGN